MRVTSDCCLFFGPEKLAATARLNCIYDMTLYIAPHLFGTGSTVARQIVIYENATYFFSLLGKNGGGADSAPPVCASVK